MNYRLKVSTGKFFTSFNDSKIKKLERLQKSVNSINKEFSDFSVDWYENDQDLDFSQEEIQSAIKRVEKSENKFRYPLADIEVDKFVEYKPHYSLKYINDNESFVVSLFKAIFGFVVPGFYIDERKSHYETRSGWSEIHMSGDLEEAVLAELYYRRTTRILSNILSKFFEFRNLITAESPIKRITYKYFDLIFSLKKEVALKTALITHFFNELFYSGENEKIYFGNIQVAGRT